MITARLELASRAGSCSGCNRNMMYVYDIHGPTTSFRLCRPCIDDLISVVATYDPRVKKKATAK